MTTRKYSSRSQQTTLTAALSSTATTASVVSGTALLGGVTISAGETFTVVIDPDTALEEIVDVTAVTGSTLTITRGIDGSSGQEHSAGAVVRHMAIGRDFREANSHIEASTGVHGITAGSSVVGTTDTQTLTNKTLTSPTINNPTINGAGVDASIVFEGATADAFETTLTVVDPTQDNTIILPNTSGTVVLNSATQTLTNKTLTAPTITGLSNPTNGGDAANKTYVDSILGSATSAAASAAAAATSATSAATSATSSATSASSSATSASAAATSATNAASSASAASTSATNAAASATAAATSATSAATSATSSATSASSSASSASAAATSATLAQDWATKTTGTVNGTEYSAKYYANAASTSASSASVSASSAATSASSSATSASSSATSASAAATSATAAASSATAAASSATSAAASAAQAASAIQAVIIDAKGDLIAGTAADTVARLPIGTNGQILTADSAQTAGMKWADAPAGYSAPTLGTTTVTSGATVSTVANLTLNNPTVTGTLTAGSTTGTNGQLLTSTGTGVQWANAPVSLPSQTGNGGKLLTTDGTTASWAGAAPVAQTTEPTNLIDGLVWLDTDGTAPTAVVTRWSKSPAAGTTSLSGNDDYSLPLSYTPGYEQVFLNGALLSRGNPTITSTYDYTATNGNTITLVTPTVAGDIVEVICPLQISTTDTYTQAQANTIFVQNANANMVGKNKIINGDMSIDQRAAGTSKSISTSGGTYPGVDRWQMAVYSGVTATTQRVTDAPVGFGYSNKWTISTGATVTSNVSSAFWQWIEGLNVQDLNWFSANARTVTLSFWAKSSVTGNHSVNILAGSSIYSYCTTYTINAANTWEYKTITIAGPTSGTNYVIDNNASVAVVFAPSCGSTYRTTANTWTSGYYQGVTGMVQLTETTGATWQVTGVQLEIGSNATAFARSAGTTEGELAACQRYYEKSYVLTTTPGSATDVGAFQKTDIAGSTTGTYGVSVEYKVTKRATPTVTLYDSLTGASGKWTLSKGGAQTATTFSIYNANQQNFVGYTTASSGLTQYAAYMDIGQWVADAEL